MKKSIRVPVLLLFALGIAFTACNSLEQKVEKSEENVVLAKNELAEAKEQYLSAIETYQQYTAEKMAANTQKIADLRTRIEDGRRSAKAGYEKNIEELEQENIELKQRVYDYHETTINNWEAFGVELKNDMNKLSVVLRDLTVKNN